VGDTLNSMRPGCGAAGDGVVVEWELEQVGADHAQDDKRVIHFMRWAFRESELCRPARVVRAVEQRGQSNLTTQTASVLFRTRS
jgi:hypothetical protein